MGPRLNHPPETAITSDTPHQSEPSSYRVRLAWSGEDADGRVVKFLIAWDDTVDAEGNPTWVETTAAESSFVVSSEGWHLARQ